MIGAAKQPEAEQIRARQAELESIRNPWESHWQELAEFVLPDAADRFASGSSGNAYLANQGQKTNTKVYDSTAIYGLRTYSAVLESMLTPRSQRWHSLQSVDARVARDPQVARWFEQVTDILFKVRYAPRANFANQMHGVFMELGAFGTGALFIDMSTDGMGLRYRAIPLSELFIDEDHQGIVDYVHRKFWLSARQAVQAFGDAVSEAVRKAADKPTQADSRFSFIHCVKPMDAYGGEKSPFVYRSVYVEEDATRTVQHGGYYAFPYAISREVAASGEKYGRSPAMSVLPDIKVANMIMKLVLTGAHFAVKPMYLGYDDGVIDTMVHTPGALITGGVNAQGQPLIQPLPTGNVGLGVDLLELTRKSIRDAFLVNIFQILTETPRMTATEVLERAREKGALLSPTMGRQQAECLGPLIQRELELLELAGVLPPAPASLLGASRRYLVEYDSPLSRAQRAEESSGVMRTLEAMAAFASVSGDVSVFDGLDSDAAVAFMSANNAVPASLLRSAGAVAAIRQARAQQQQVQQMADLAPGAAAVLKATEGRI